MKQSLAWHRLGLSWTSSQILFAVRAVFASLKAFSKLKVFCSAFFSIAKPDTLNKVDLQMLRRLIYNSLYPKTLHGMEFEEESGHLGY